MLNAPSICNLHTTPPPLQCWSLCVTSILEQHGKGGTGDKIEWDIENNEARNTNKEKVDWIVSN